MKVHKENQHSVTLRPFLWRGKRYLMVCVGLYVNFDPAGGSYRLSTEQEFWEQVPDAFETLSSPPVLDFGLPKPGAEVLVAGACRSQSAQLIKSQEISFRVGNVSRKLVVYGDRQRLPGGGVSEPVPFKVMPLTWDRAFGGESLETNPIGKGLDKDNKVTAYLPNIENPQHLMITKDDRPEPVCPFTIDLANPSRRKLSGTYDQNWLDTRFPAYPDDCNPSFFFSAQESQRLTSRTGENLFFEGGEPIEIIGMHHQYPHIRSTLPTEKIRAFVLTKKEFKPFESTYLKGKPDLPYAKDLEEEGIFHEVNLRCDTVWLIPDLMGAFVMYRGLLEVVDDEMDDIIRTFIVTETKEHHTIEYYREELRKRANPAIEIDLAPFIEAQAKTSKAVKMALDYPKLIDRIKQDALKQRPVMPMSLGDMQHSLSKTFEIGRQTLDTVEKEVLSLRNQFSHLVSFDMSIFSKMRNMIDGQEKNFEEVMASAKENLAIATQHNEEAKKKAKEAIEKALEIKPTDDEAVIAKKLEARAQAQPKIDLLDSFSTEGLLTEPEKINAWHDRGFPIVIAARRALTRNDSVLIALDRKGLENRTVNDAWIGFSHEPYQDNLKNWGQDDQEFTLPSGLYVPRFKGRELINIYVYPLHEENIETIQGLGVDSKSIVVIPNAPTEPLYLAASHPNGALLVVPEDLTAYYAEQEVGDFCQIVSTNDPNALANIEDVADYLKEDSSLPLIVLLPEEKVADNLFEPWEKVYPKAIAAYLPKKCQNVLDLKENGERLRRVILDVMPPEVAQKHDFDFPIPSKDKPIAPFTLNLPLPTAEEIKKKVNQTIAAIYAGYPDVHTEIEKLKDTAKQEILKSKDLALNSLPLDKKTPEMLEKINTKFDQALEELANPKEVPNLTGSEVLEKNLKDLDDVKKYADKLPTPESKELFLNKIAEAENKVKEMQPDIAALDQLKVEGFAKLDALDRGELPEEVQKAFDEKGMDPNALKRLTRQDVERILAGDKDLSKRNLQGVDLSGLDFTNANLANAICSKANFTNAILDNVDFTFTLANEANFTKASLKGAFFKQTVLQQTILKEANFARARFELTTLGEADLEKANFEGALLKLTNFTKSSLKNVNFKNTEISLCIFNEVLAAGADFSRANTFKCLFQNSNLEGTLFEEAILNESLFQGAFAKGVSFERANLEKWHVDNASDLSECNFTQANLKEASLRLSYFMKADFYQANLQGALILQCDLSHALIDGISAVGCQFHKCNLNGADLSGINLMNGSLYKCSLDATDLSGANLYASNLNQLTINHQTKFDHANLKRSPFDGKEEALRDLARRRS